MTRETRLGILFFLCLGTALWFTLFVTDIWAGDGRYTIRFDRVLDLRAGDVVTYNGVRVGKVQDVRPVLSADGGSEIQVNFNVDEDLVDAVLLNDSSEFTVNQGFLGGAKLVIRSSGPGQPISESVLASHRGVEPVDIDAAIAEVAAMIRENRPGLKQAIDQLPGAVNTMNEMGAEIRDLARSNKETIGEAVVAMRDMARTIQGTVAENREAIAEAVDEIGAAGRQINSLVETNKDAVTSAIAALPEAADSFKELGKDLRGLVADNRDRIDAIITNLSDFTPRLERIGKDIETVTGQIASGQGSIGQAVFDDTLISGANRAIASVEQRAEEVKGVTSGFAQTKFYGGTWGGANARSGVFHGGAYVRIEPKPWRFYQGGLVYRSEPEWADQDPWLQENFINEMLLFGPEVAYTGYLWRDTRVEDSKDDLYSSLFPDVSIGFRFWPDNDIEKYRLSIRAGVIEGFLGAEGSVHLTEDLTFWAMARQADGSTYENGQSREKGPAYGRAWFEYRLWNRLHLTAGVDDLFFKPGAYGGIRVELLDQDIRNLITVGGLL
jgi:ABC-type transporter Mla subunit MlaD